MKQKKTSVRENVRLDLLVPPHVVDKLVNLFADTWQLDTVQLEQLAAHLKECSPCRTFLIALLGTEANRVNPNSNPENPAHDLLMRFVNLHHKIESQEYEQLGAYAEAIIAKGENEADKRFPTIAEHIHRCSGCKSVLEETLAFLREPE